MSIHSISETYYSGPINSTLRGSSNDVRLFGTGKAAHSDGKDVDEENGDDADIDGEGLLWDAQVSQVLWSRIRGTNSHASAS